MTKKELIAKFNDLEWEDFEVKEAKAAVPKSCWETVNAFSNTAGGWLVFGVKEIGSHYTLHPHIPAYASLPTILSFITLADCPNPLKN